MTGAYSKSGPDCGFSDGNMRASPNYVQKDSAFSLLASRVEGGQVS